VTPRRQPTAMFLAQGIRTARLIVEPIALDAPPAALADGLAEFPDPAMLESTARQEAFGRHSLLTCRPLEVLTLHQGLLRDRAGNVLANGDEEIWQALHRAFAAVNVSPSTGEGFAPGWVGYIGYELGRHIEALPGRAVRDTHLPDLRLAFYDALLVYDLIEQQWQLVHLEFDDPPSGAGEAAEILRSLTGRECGASAAQPAPAELADATKHPAVVADACNFTPDQYLQAVQKCIDYIAAGDIFQVNLSQRFTIRSAPAPLEIYSALRRRNPAWYAAYLQFQTGPNTCAVVSSSPELFLRLRGDRVITRPIKGTRPRVGRPLDDKAAADELLGSEKDSAELAMIVDLLRNDLGRVCRFGTVRVTEPRRLEVHPTVFHLVGTVEGQLRPGIGAAELLRATFPGGSITGAPKIRAMEIIDELEPTARGVYTGCIGIVGVNGTCEFNIVIRTVVCDGRVAHFQVGGGIVADSTPEGEYQETLDKARALREAIAAARHGCYDETSGLAVRKSTGQESQE